MQLLSISMETLGARSMATLPPAALDGAPIQALRLCGPSDRLVTLQVLLFLPPTSTFLESVAQQVD